ncbi:hypothetical protein EIP86_010992 [Pleurotus ostreatoroseus]|nr:hypothetical protein EIP86_010992 [Pleurotus ostreatoroseus]
MLQAAAGRAWTRTRPARVRTYHRTGTANQGEVHVAQTAGRLADSYPNSAGPSRVLEPPKLPWSDRQNATPSVKDVLSKKGLQSCADEEVSGDRVDSAEAMVASGSLEEFPDNPKSTKSLRKNRKSKRRDAHRREVYVCDVDDGDIPDVDPGLDPSPTYEADPPWEDVAYTAFLPSVFPRDPSPNYSKYIPRDETTMHRILLSLVLPGSVPPLEKLVRFHASYPEYQSNASFNFIISLSLQQDNNKVARKLLEEMQERGFGDVETRLLRVRMMIRSGRWEEAWEMESTRCPLPLAIWMEFAQGSREPQLRQTLKQRKFAREGKHIDVPSQAADNLRTRLLFKHFPTMHPNKLAKMPARVIFVVCRWMIQNGERETAMQITTAFFNGLRREISLQVQRRCTDIIHLHLLPRGTEEQTAESRSEFTVAYKTVKELLAMHPSFRPDATTLFFLLRTLKRSHLRTIRALRLATEFRKRWGPDVIDQRVRRRLLSIALSENQLRIANQLAKQHGSARESAEEELAQWSDIVDRWTTVRESTEQLRHRELFPQQGTEKSKSGALFKRLRRLKRQAFRDKKRAERVKRAIKRAEGRRNIEK